MWGIAIGGAILQNELNTRLPQEFLDSIAQASNGSSQSAELVYAVIPLVKDLSEPLKQQVQVAFAESIRRIWIVMTAIAVLGLLSSFLMRDVPLQSKVDPDTAMQRNSNDGTVGEASVEINLKQQAETV